MQKPTSAPNRSAAAPATGARRAAATPASAAAAAASSHAPRTNAPVASARAARPSAGSSSSRAASSATSAPTSSARAAAAARPGSGSMRLARHGAAAAAGRSESALDPAAVRIPLHIASDPLSRLTTPLLHILSAHLRVPEVLTLARANRILFCAMMTHDTPWRKRWAKAAAAGAGANKQGTTAAAPGGAPAARGGGARPAAAPRAPASKAPAATSTSAPPPAAARGSLPSLVPTALAHFQNQSAQAHSLYPASLPPSSPYRWALLDHIRSDSAARFSSWASNRCRNRQHTLVHKPVVEQLGIKLQLKLQLHKRPLQLPIVSCTLFDNSLVAAWPVQEPGLLLRDLRSVSLLGHSSKLMQSLPLGGPADVASSHNRSWRCVRQASAPHAMSLLEWQLTDAAQIAAAQAQAAAASDSPFEPNAAAQARASAAASARSAHASRSADANSLPIPGMGLKVLAGVWGPWAQKTAASSSASASAASNSAAASAYNGTELAFLWCSMPYALVLAHLPAEALPTPSPLRQPRWLLHRDDLDSLLGQHSLRVNLCFRNLTRTMWSFFLPDISAELRREIPRPSGAPGKGAMVLKLPDLSALAPKWSQLPNLPWKAQLWAGRFERLCILDLVVAIEERVLWIVSAPLDLRPLEASAAAGEHYASMDEPHVLHFQGTHHQPGVGACALEITHAPAVHVSADGRRVEQVDAASIESSSSVEGTTRLQSLRIGLDLDFIDERLGTLYARTGSASMSHALQSRAYAEMSPAEYAEFQRQQMRLRSEEELERPLGRSAGAGAAAAPFVPQFAVHAPAPAPAAGGRGAVPGPNAAAAAARRSRGAASSSSSSSSSVRPQWQDIVEKADDDAGFKF